MTGALSPPRTLAHSSLSSTSTAPIEAAAIEAKVRYLQYELGRVRTTSELPDARRLRSAELRRRRGNVPMSDFDV